MPSDLEGVSFDGVALNDQTTWQAESLVIAPPSKRLERLASPDADADILAEAARHDLRTVTLKLRYVGSTSINAALGEINGLSARLQRAEELNEGSPLIWTPANSTRTGTMYVQSGEITDLPVVVEGEDAGWFFANPAITIRFDCFPFIYGTEYLAGSAGASANRILTLLAANVLGTVPGLGRLVITDAAAQNRAHVEIGGDRYGYNASASLDILGSSMTALGGTLSGSYMSATVGTAPVAVAEATPLVHKGPHNVRAQVGRTTTGTTLRVRAAAQTVDGPWSYTPWKTVPSGIGTYDLNLGLLDFATVKKGTQASTLRFEAYASAATVVRIYRFNPIPTEVVYGRVRMSSQLGATPTSYVALDAFDQTAGDLGTKTAGAGGAWTTSGATTDFAVEATGHTARRSAINDTSARFAVLGLAVTTSAAQVDVKFSSTGLSPILGLLLCYVDSTNYLVLRLQPFFGTLDLLATSTSSSTVLATATSPFFKAINTAYTLRAAVDDNGNWRAWWGVNGAANYPFGSGNSSLLATGGALASGKVGLYDYNSYSSAVSRTYDNFYAWIPPFNATLYSGRSMEWRNDSVIRENSAGTGWGTLTNRGRNLYIPPAGPGNLTTRLAIKDRRSDVDADVADSPESARSAALYVTPRYLAVPG